jgi:hypothetical protein
VSPVEFQSCRIATSDGSEDACLCLRDGVILALLVRHGDGAPAGQGWYLHSGFGPCQREGLVFGTLDEARDWLEQTAAAGCSRTKEAS